ncbi:MAG: hypothetical protein R2741_12130 [Methanolobus sp.]
MDRSELDALVDERIRYTVKYAAENSLFYKKWFRENNVSILISEAMKTWNSRLYLEK